VDFNSNALIFLTYLFHHRHVFFEGVFNKLEGMIYMPDRLFHSSSLVQCLLILLKDLSAHSKR
jgi:hypothetical protein